MTDRRAAPPGPRLLALVATLLVAAAPTRAEAQSQSAAVPITVWIDAALTGAAVQNLDFGVMAPGSSVTIAPQAGPVVAQWYFPKISGAKQATRAFVQLTFAVLPAALVHTTGTATLPVSWTNAARSCLAAQKGAEYYCHPAWTPVQGVMHSVRINPDPAGEKGGRDLNVYLGGTVAPPATQRAGTYSGVVTLQFVYGST